MKMTEEQKKFANKNIRLMYSFIRDKREAGVIPYYLKDDFISDMALRFCSATINFDKAKGCKFSTFAYGGFNMGCSYLRCQKTLSYNRNNFVDHSKVEALAERSSKEKDHVEEAILLSVIRKADLTKKEMFVLRGYFFDRKTMVEIGQEIELSRGRVFQIKKILLNKIRKIASIEKLSFLDFYE